MSIAGAKPCWSWSTILNPNWPTAGDLGAAYSTALVEAGLAGLVLGVVYWKSRENLVAVIAAHALIDTFPAMTLIRFG